MRGASSTLKVFHLSGRRLKPALVDQLFASENMPLLLFSERKLDFFFGIPGALNRNNGADGVK